MKIRISIIFILVCIIIGILSGCGSSTSDTESSTSESRSPFETMGVDYTINDDGTYTCRDHIYQYKLEVSGMDGESKVTFIVLTNDTEISGEDIIHDWTKAEISIGIPKYVVLGWY